MEEGVGVVFCCGDKGGVVGVYGGVVVCLELEFLYWKGGMVGVWLVGWEVVVFVYCFV